MANEGKLSRLDIEGRNWRETVMPGKNRYEDEVNPYSLNHDDAKTHNDDQHPWGKGNGKSMTYAVRNLNAPKTQINYSNVDTRSSAGGSYDIYGTVGVDMAYQGESGRKFLERINEYKPGAEYGKNSVDIDASKRGQYVTTTRNKI
jgi:hypothetical protein